MNALILIFTLQFALVLACAGQNNVSKKSFPDKEIQYKLYNKSIGISIKGDQVKSDITFISLHSNETTAQQVVSNYLKRNSGTFIVLQNKKQRLVKFSIANASYIFNPNRIFTLKGIQLTLRRNGSYSPYAAGEIKKLALFITNKLSKAKTAVAVHNNTNGKFSILSYMRKGKLFINSKGRNYNPTIDPDDFFLTTCPQIFKKLKARGFNVVLQDNLRVFDDGSLSVFYRKTANCYVNIEAQHGHAVEQAKMLSALISIIQ